MKTFLHLSLLLAAAAAQACPCGCVRAPADVALDRLGAEERAFAVELRHDSISQDERVDGAHAHIAADHRLDTLVLDARLDGIRWTLSLPYVERELRLVMAGQSQTIRGLGDISLVARVPAGSVEIIAGLKLPTGADRDELLVKRRYLQLGTGSTDLILGVRAEGEVAGLARGFVQLTGQAAVDHDEHFRPGASLGLAAGLSRELGAGFSLVLQASAVRQFRDHNTMVQVDPAYGEDKESDILSVAVTPGLVWQSGSGTRAYVLLTEPVEDRNYAEQGGVVVNPIHASRVLTVGLSHAF